MAGKGFPGSLHEAGLHAGRSGLRQLALRPEISEPAGPRPPAAMSNKYLRHNDAALKTCPPITRGRIPSALFEAVDDRDVGIIHEWERLGFAVEARQPLRIQCEGVRQHFDRHVPPRFVSVAR